MCVSVSRDILLMESPAAVSRFRESDRGRAASGHPCALPSESSEMNINMNEGADQPAGKTGSRRKRAGTKRWTELKKKKKRLKKQNPSGELASTLQDGGGTEEETPRVGG